jgi:rod shape-determining protein MreC
MMEWLHRLRGVLLILLLLSILLYIVSLNFRGAERMDPLQRLVVETLAPVAGVVEAVTSGVDRTIQEYILLRQTHRENRRLKNRIASLEQQVADYYEAYLENQRLRRLLDFKRTLPSRTVAAPVIVHNSTGWFQNLIVGKGFEDGVHPDSPVVNDEGVVGRVLDVSDHYSRVMLVTDPESAVDALIQRNRVRGILSGKDEKTCILKYVRSNLDVRRGDLVITSGKDGIFRRGLRLGVVQGTVKDPLDLFQVIEVKPTVRLGSLEEVMIIEREAPPEWSAEEQ